MRTILLIGGGGHCKSCIDVIEAVGTHVIAGYVDKNKNTYFGTLATYPCFGSDDDLQMLIEQYKEVLIAVGQIKSPDIRIDLYRRAKVMGAVMPVIISPHAYVSKHAEILAGTIVMHGGLVNAGAKISENCIINSQALIEHDATIESNCHISTGAKLNGDTYIEAGSFIGSGAVICQGVRVGARCIIGAGTTVLRDIPAGTIYKRGCNE